MTSFSGSVEAVIEAARQLLGSGEGPVDWPAVDGGQPLVVPDDWEGPAAEVVAVPAGRLAGQRSDLDLARSGAAGAVAAAGAISREAHSALDALEAAWEQDKSAFAEQSGSVAGKGSLLQAGIARIDEARAIVREAAERFSDAAQQLRRFASGGHGSDEAVSDR